MSARQRRPNSSIGFVLMHLKGFMGVFFTQVKYIAINFSSVKYAIQWKIRSKYLRYFEM